MKFAITVTLVSSASAFLGPSVSRESTSLSATRRDALVNVARGTGLILGTIVAPKAVNAVTANPFFLDEINNEPSQQARSDKLDINGSFVVSLLASAPCIIASSVYSFSLQQLSLTQTDYKQLPGFYPHAAGKIASNGPYKTVADIYNIPGLTGTCLQWFELHVCFAVLHIYI
jgi:photosystem II PsbU protein